MPRGTKEVSLSSTLVAIAGLPLAGKTTLGRNLESVLGIHYCDSDDLRHVAFGLPTHKEYDALWQDPDRATKLMAQNMKLAYMLLHNTVDMALGAQRPLIISACYSSESSQKFLKEVVSKHGTTLRLVMCELKKESREELEARMRRNDGDRFVTGTKTWADYEQVKARYASPVTSGVFSEKDILVVDTSSPIKDFSAIIDFIKGE